MLASIFCLLPTALSWLIFWTSLQFRSGKTSMNTFQIDAYCSSFQSQNMLPFHVRLGRLKLTYYSKFFLDISLKLTLCLFFLSSHVLASLQFDSHYFNILLWKIAKQSDHNEIKPPIAKIFPKYKPIRQFVMSRKQLLCSFVNKVYDNCNKVSYLQKNKKNALTWKPLSRRK